MIKVSAEHIKALSPTLTAERCAEIADNLNPAMAEFGISTPKRVCHFVAQVAHESAHFKRFDENLNYSVRGLQATWPSRFGRSRSHTPLQRELGELMARAIARKPKMIGAFVYADRLGNGSYATGDGWTYRGRGPIQLTGRANYRTFGEELSLDLEGDPDMAALPEVGFRIAGLYWADRGLNDCADRDDITEITRRIRGSSSGVEVRRAVLSRVREVVDFA